MSRHRTSYIDHQLRASNFEVGDLVKYVEPVKGKSVSYVGTVTSVLDSIGFVDVEFSWGNVRIDPINLIHVDDKKAPLHNTALDTWERRNAVTSSAIAKKLAHTYRVRLAHLYRTAAGCGEAGISQMDTYHLLYRHFQRKYADSEVKEAIAEIFSTPTQVRQAMYWKEKGRRYVPTQQEMEEGIFHCPRCKEEMKRTVYKKMTKLYACPGCLFLIKPADILDCTDPSNEGECGEDDEGLAFEVRNPANSVNEWL